MSLTKKDYRAEKIDAYEVAINSLLAYESDGDSELSRKVRERLAAKLERDIQRLVNKWKA